jgi:hypothetical protein
MKPQQQVLQPIKAKIVTVYMEQEELTLLERIKEKIKKTTGIPGSSSRIMRLALRAYAKEWEGK